MEKRDPYKFTIKFNAMDPIHRIAVKRLLTLDKSKATYIASLIASDLERYSLLDEIKSLPDPVPDTSTRPETGHRSRFKNNYVGRERVSERQPEAHTEAYKQEEETVSAAEMLSELMDKENDSIIASTLGIFEDDDDEEEV